MSIQRVSIIGAGTTAIGIAQACAVAGLQVILVGVSKAALDLCLAMICANLDRMVHKGTLPAADSGSAIDRIQLSPWQQGLQGVQLVIGVVTEDPGLKLPNLRDVKAVVAIDATENVADARGITREDMDTVAAQSQRRACAAINAGSFKGQSCR